METFEKFLHDDDFFPLRDRLLSEDFSWFHIEKQLALDTQLYTDFFTHSIYYNHEINSNCYHLITPFLKKMNIRAIIAIRVNLVTIKHERVIGNFHTDYRYQDSKTAIYYLNTNNGYTEFKNKKIKSLKNKMIIFDASLKHRAKAQTDKDVRVVINFNYELN